MASYNIDLVKTVVSAAVKKTVLSVVAESVVRYGTTVYGSYSNNKMQAINTLIFIILRYHIMLHAILNYKKPSKAASFGMMPLQIGLIYVGFKGYYFSQTEFKPVKTKLLRDTDRFYVPRIHKK